MPLLKKNLEPTDFADADCRVTEFIPYAGTINDSYRIWLCRCGGGYWFQRHEWTRPGANQTIMDDWIFSGYSPYRRFPGHVTPAPNTDDL